MGESTMGHIEDLMAEVSTQSNLCVKSYFIQDGPRWANGYLPTTFRACHRLYFVNGAMDATSPAPVQKWSTRGYGEAERKLYSQCL